jgi:hypothetical protein
LIEHVIDIRRHRWFVASDLAFRVVKVEGHAPDASSPLEARAGFPGVGGKAVNAEPEVGAKSCARGIVAAQHVLLERARKEFLCEIGCFVSVEMPLQPQVFVDRLPIRFDEC